MKHIGFANHLFFGPLMGENIDAKSIEENANGPANLKTKAEIVQYLKDSFAYIHKAIATVNEKNLVEPLKSPFGEGPITRLSVATSVVGHGFDHYVQMVEYLRLNGIVPPASR